MRLKQSPYHLLLLAGLVLVLLSFFPDRGKTVDIHVHDTYYIIAQGHVFIIFAIIVWILWALYLLTRKVLYSNSLTWIHVIITLLALLVLLFLLNFGGVGLSPRRYLDFSIWNTFNAFHPYMRWVSFLTIALLLGQIIFIVNLITGIVNHVTSQ